MRSAAETSDCIVLWHACNASITRLRSPSSCFYLIILPSPPDRVDRTLPIHHNPLKVPCQNIRHSIPILLRPSTHMRRNQAIIQPPELTIARKRFRIRDIQTSRPDPQITDLPRVPIIPLRMWQHRCLQRFNQSLLIDRIPSTDVDEYGVVAHLTEGVGVDKVFRGGAGGEGVDDDVAGGVEFFHLIGVFGGIPFRGDVCV